MIETCRISKPISRFGIIFSGVALLAAAPAQALCSGSRDKDIVALDRATAANSAHAVGLIRKELAMTPADDVVRRGWLQIILSNALAMSGQKADHTGTFLKANLHRLGASPDLVLMLRLTALSEKDINPAEAARQSMALRPHLTRLEQGSPARICGASAIAFDLWEADRAAESFPLMVEAYRDSAGMGLERAEASSNLAEAIRISGDYQESAALHREALAYYQANQLHDLAAEEWSLIGWSLLEDGKPADAIIAFEQSVAAARRIQNRYAELYAKSGLCESYIDRREAAKAEPYCRDTFEAMKGSGQLIEYSIAAVEGGRLAGSGQHRAALAILNPLLSEHQNMLGDHYRIVAYQSRARAHQGLGMQAAAFADMEKAAELLRDQYRRSQRQSNAVARARFQFEELGGRLALQKQQNRAQAKLFMIAGLFGSIVITLLALLVGREMRNRRNLETQARTDPLTGLLNRRSMHEFVEQAIAESERGRNSVLMLIDVDHFKRCNDQYGHEAGDSVLMAFADVMRRHIRTGDAVGRWGGEEFLLILRDANFSDARHIISTLREEAARMAVDAAPDFTLRFSGGAVEIGSAPATNADMLVNLADMLLYEAKHSGRDQICYANANWFDLATELRRKSHPALDTEKPNQRPADAVK